MAAMTSIVPRVLGLDMLLEIVRLFAGSRLEVRTAGYWPRATAASSRAMPADDERNAAIRSPRRLARTMLAMASTASSGTTSGHTLREGSARRGAETSAAAAG